MMGWPDLVVCSISALADPPSNIFVANSDRISGPDFQPVISTRLFPRASSSFQPKAFSAARFQDVMRSCSSVAYTTSEMFDRRLA